MYKMQNDVNCYMSESEAYCWQIIMKIKNDNYTLIFEQEITILFTQENKINNN